MRPLITLFLLFTTIIIQAQVPRVENNQLMLDNLVTFKTASSELTDEGKEALKQVKEFLVAKDYISLLRVEAHSDNSSDESATQKLTEQRALAVSRWLIANGIDCKRLIAVGFGSTKPVESNDNPRGRAANRRMVFSLAALRGRLIGGMPADGGGVVAGDLCKEDK